MSSSRSRSFVAVAVCLFSLTLSAQYSTSAPYAPLTIPPASGASSCTVTWYDPDVFVRPTATELGLLAQGGAPNTCQTLPYDAIFAGKRDSGGTWTVPAASSCPKLKGEYISCGFSGGVNAGPISSPSVVRVANVNSASGQRYFMAFTGGNADYIHGKIYWAYSDDGETWTVYNSGVWSPLVQAKYERSASQPHSTPACDKPSGIGQLQLAYQSNYMYLFIQYYHPIQPGCEGENGHESATCINSGYQGYDRALSSVLLRFPYDGNHPYGFGGAYFQIYEKGSWKYHSGKLVWAYDDNASGGQLPADTTLGTTNPVLDLYDGVQAAGFEYGAGDIKYGNGKWLHTWAFGTGTYVQTATSLDPAVATWSTAQTLDLSAYQTAYSNMTSNAVGLHYGALRKADGSYTGTHWWVWAAVPTNNTACYDYLGNRNAAAGLSLVPAQLCTPDVPCGP